MPAYPRKRASRCGPAGGSRLGRAVFGALGHGAAYDTWDRDELEERWDTLDRELSALDASLAGTRAELRDAGIRTGTSRRKAAREGAAGRYAESALARHRQSADDWSGDLATAALEEWRRLTDTRAAALREWRIVDAELRQRGRLARWDDVVRRAATSARRRRAAA